MLKEPQKVQNVGACNMFSNPSGKGRLLRMIGIHA